MCIEKKSFYIPNDGKMKLQFFHVEDLCKLIEIIINQHFQDQIINVGNNEIIDINRFVELCYQIVNVPLKKVFVDNSYNQRDYFSFHNYEYILDVTKQNKLLLEQKDLITGLMESYQWYLDHPTEIIKKDYYNFIDSRLKNQFLVD